MDEFIKLLDPNLHYLRHEISDEELLIYVESERLNVKCPYCGQLSSRRHSMYERSFQDLPMMGKNKKYPQIPVPFIRGQFHSAHRSPHYKNTQTGDYWDKPVKEGFPTKEHNATFAKNRRP